MRRLILKGDKTTVGGTVLEGVQSGVHEGKAISFHGAQIHCPVCKSTGMIVGDGPSMPMTFNGKQVALERDICSCQCDPSPRLIASQSATTLGVASSPDLTNSSESVVGAPVQSIGPYNEQIRINDESGAPMRNIPYFIEDQEGRTYQGVTDGAGLCPRVFTPSRQKLTITLGMQALARWKDL